MATIAVDKTKVRIADGVSVFSGVAGEALTAGALVKVDGTDGTIKKAAADDVVGIATGGVKGDIAKGTAVDVVRQGIVDGISQSADFGQVLKAGASGVIDDAAGINVGFVIPGTAVAAGQGYDKLMYIDVAYEDESQ